MKKINSLLCIVFSISTLMSNAQIKVDEAKTLKNKDYVTDKISEKENSSGSYRGYIIKNNGEKVSGVFKRANYYDNPESVKFKSDSNSDFKIITVAEIKAFSIGEHIKYLSAMVKMDMSSDKISNLSYLKKPEFEDRNLFLKVLLEGDASLYVYYEGGLKKYFYKIREGEVVQLIYKRYLKNGKDIFYNNQFRQQISSSFFDCKDIKQNKYTNIKYTLNSLAKIFSLYNSCKGSETTKLYKRESRLDFSLMPRIGMYNTTISISNSKIETLGADFGKNVGLKYGLWGQASFENWSVFVGFESNSLINKTVSIQTSSSDIRQDVSIDYKAFEVMAGLKYRFVLDHNSGVSILAGLVNESRSSFEIDYELSPDIDEMQSDANILFGLGYNYKRINVDAKMNLAKKFFPDSSRYDSNITDISIMLGYELF